MLLDTETQVVPSVMPMSKIPGLGICDVAPPTQYIEGLDSLLRLNPGLLLNTDWLSNEKDENLQNITHATLYLPQKATKNRAPLPPRAPEST
jgi:hypothetical protein